MEGLGKKANTIREVRRLQDLEEEVARLMMEAKQPQEKDKKCQTCPKGQHPPGRCAGKKADKCFACGLSGHFKAPTCKGGGEKKKKTGGKIRKVKQKEVAKTDK